MIDFLRPHVRMSRRVATLKDLRKDAAGARQDVPEADERYYVGGRNSGLVVEGNTNPNDEHASDATMSNLINNMLQKAHEYVCFLSCTCIAICVYLYIQ